MLSGTLFTLKVQKKSQCKSIYFHCELGNGQGHPAPCWGPHLACGPQVEYDQRGRYGNKIVLDNLELGQLPNSRWVKSSVGDRLSWRISSVSTLAKVCGWYCSCLWCLISIKSAAFGSIQLCSLIRAASIWVPLCLSVARQPSVFIGYNCMYCMTIDCMYCTQRGVLRIPFLENNLLFQ